MTTTGGAPSSGGSVYSYDGDGRRVKKVVGAVTTFFVYDAAGRVVAEYGNEQAQGSGTSYLTQDSLGSTRVVTGQQQEVKGRYDYLPFGEEVYVGRFNYGGNDDIRQKFASYERDNETSLDYAKARYYSSAQGRFTSVDPLMASAKPVNPQTWNRYTYVLNRPTIAIDPNGLSIIVVVVAPRSNGGDGHATVQVFDRDGQGVNVRGDSNRIEGKAVGVNGPRRDVSGGDTPFGVYRILPNYRGSNENGTQGGEAGVSARGKDTRFGTGIITMEPVSGEAVDNGRSAIDIHGGGRPLDQALEDQQPLTPTEGCVRVHNEDINSLISTVNNQATNGDPVVNIFVGDAPTLNSIADQQDSKNGTYLYPELRNAGFGSPDKQGRLPGSTGHENADPPREEHDR